MVLSLPRPPIKAFDCSVIGCLSHGLEIEARNSTLNPPIYQAERLARIPRIRDTSPLTRLAPRGGLTFFVRPEVPDIAVDT